MQVLGTVHETIKEELLSLLLGYLQQRGLTPYIIVWIPYPGVSLPDEYLQNEFLTLDISANACQQLIIKDGWISFLARFHGVSRSVQFPVLSVRALFGTETDEGMQFSVSSPQQTEDSKTEQSGSPSKKPARKPSLRVIK